MLLWLSRYWQEKGVHHQMPRLMLLHPLVPTCHGEAGFGWRTAETTCSVRVDH